MTASKLTRERRGALNLINGDFRLTHRLSLVTGLLCLALALPALSDAAADHYRQTHATADGIGKTYMGREIAQVTSKPIILKLVQGRFLIRNQRLDI